MNAHRLLAHFDAVVDTPGAVQRLRRFILDLAVRGKLVPQDPNEGPASELLKLITKEKNRLVEAREIRRQKPLRELSREEMPFTLPANWAWSQAAEIGVLSPRNSAPDDVQASFVPMSMIASEYGAPNRHEIRRWAEIKSGYTHFAEGDVGVAKITPCFENGKSTVFRNLAGGLGSGTTELHIVRPLFVDPRYVVLFFKCPYFIESGIPKMTGTAGQKRVSAEYFAHSPFPLPPLAEQRRIVARVNELMALCERLDAAIAEREATRDRFAAASLARLSAPEPDPVAVRAHAVFVIDNFDRLTTRSDQIKTLRRTILKLAVRGALVAQDPSDEPASTLLNRITAERDRLVKSGKAKKRRDVSPVSESEIPFVLPSGWSPARLADVAICLDHLRKPINAAERTRRIAGKAQSELFPYFGATQQQGWIDDFLFDEELVLLGEDGVPFLDPLRPKAYVVSGKSWVNNHAHVFRGIFISHMYLAHWLNAFDYSGRIVGATRAKLNQSRATDIPIMLPPLAEQHRIVARVDELMALCDRLEERLVTMEGAGRRLLRAMLHEALEPDTGGGEEAPAPVPSAAPGKRQSA